MLTKPWAFVLVAAAAGCSPTQQPNPAHTSPSTGAHQTTTAPALREYTELLACYDPGGKVAKTRSTIRKTRAYSEYEEQEVYRDVRYDTNGYTLKIPNGSYHVLLSFCEIQGYRPGQRVFGVKVQGMPFIDRLDIAAKVGQNTAYRVKSPDVKVSDGLLRIEFVRIVGSPCVAAMSIGGRMDGDGSPDPFNIYFQHINCGGPSFRGYYADFGM